MAYQKYDQAYQPYFTDANIDALQMRIEMLILHLCVASDYRYLERRDVWYMLHEMCAESAPYGERCWHALNTVADATNDLMKNVRQYGLMEGREAANVQISEVVRDEIFLRKISHSQSSISTNMLHSSIRFCKDFIVDDEWELLKMCLAHRPEAWRRTLGERLYDDIINLFFG